MVKAVLLFDEYKKWYASGLGAWHDWEEWNKNPIIVTYDRMNNYYYQDQWYAYVYVSEDREVGIPLKFLMEV